MIGQKKQELAGAPKRRRGSATAIGLALGVGLAMFAAPVSVHIEDGGVSLASNAVLAQGKGNNGNNGRGNGGGRGGNGGGNAGGNAGGVSGGNGNAPGGAGSGGTHDDHSGPGSNAGQGVVVAQFTTEIRKRAPVNQVDRLEDPYQAVSFFTELVGMQGHTVTHRWIYKGVERYRVTFPVRTPDSKIWSTQFLPDNMPGTWLVEVTDEEANLLQSSRLEFRPAG